MGREAGTPNKNKVYLMNRLQDMYGKDFHPIMNMAKNCVVLQVIADGYTAEMTKQDYNDVQAVEEVSTSAIKANEAWDKMAQYVQPKLKAIEHNGGTDEDGLPRSITISINRDKA